MNKLLGRVSFMPTDNSKNELGFDVFKGDKATHIEARMIALKENIYIRLKTTSDFNE